MRVSDKPTALVTVTVAYMVALFVGGSSLYLLNYGHLLNILLADLVATLTAHHEAGRDPGWQPQYPQSMLAAIVGVEITVTDIQCKYKLSQNRPVSDRERVADELEQAGAGKLAAAMREQL